MLEKKVTWPLKPCQCVCAGGRAPKNC